MIKLEPCSCGGDAHFDEDDDLICVRCEDCSAETPMLHIDGDYSDRNMDRLRREARKLWNRML